MYYEKDLNSDVLLIKSLLESFKEADADSFYFNQVINLSDIELNRQEELQLVKMLFAFNPGDPILHRDSIRDQRNLTLANQLAQTNLFLNIRENTRPQAKTSRLLLSLYQALPVSGKINEEIIYLPVKGTFPIEETVVDLPYSYSADQLEQTIKEGLVKLFRSDLNFPPQPVVKINGENHQKEKLFYHVATDTLTLDASYTKDLDSPRDRFQFSWRQIDLDGKMNVPLNQEVRFIQRNRIAKVILRDTGRIAIGLTVGDGIEEAKEDTFFIQGIPRPHLQLSKLEYRSHSRVSLFQEMLRKGAWTGIIEDSIQASVVGMPHPVWEAKYTYAGRSFYGRASTISGKWIPQTQQYYFKTKGIVGRSDVHQFTIWAESEGLRSDSATYIMRHPTLNPASMSVGFSIFPPVFKSQSFCVSADSLSLFPIAGEIGVGIYLAHWGPRSQSLKLDVGLMNLFGESNSGSLDNFLLRASLKYEFYDERDILGYVLSLNSMATTETSSVNDPVFRNHFGLGLGMKIYDFEIDLFNIYWNPGVNCYSLVWGVRYDFAGRFFKYLDRQKTVRSKNK